MKTGTTGQVQYTEITFDEELQFLYMPGIYHSYNINDAMPGKRELRLEQQNGITLIANTLDEVLNLWVEQGQNPAMTITSLG